MKNLLRLCLLSFLIFNWMVIYANEEEVILKQKIGQMLLFGFQGNQLHPNDSIIQAILKQNIGGVILFDYNSHLKTYDYNIQNPTQLKQLTQKLQFYTQQAAKDHHNKLYPLLISIDYEGGQVKRLLEKQGFPPTLSAAEIAQGSSQQAQKKAEQMAETLQQEGVNVNFAPVVDLNLNPNNPVIGKKERSFSADPKEVVKFAEIFSKAYYDHHILCSYKHFPGHGSSAQDSHQGFVDVTRSWQNQELEPYQLLLKKSYACPMVMIAHVVNSKLDPQNYPASLSEKMINQLLRKKLNFNGVVITDDLQMKAISEHYSVQQAVRLAINAGTDILIFGNNLVAVPQDPQKIVNMIYDDVKTGKIPRSRIDESFERIIQLKNQLMI